MKPVKRTSRPHTLVVHLIIQDKILYHKMDPGIILSNLSLVIQNVRRDHAGTYFCLATNAHGNGSSNPVQLNVQCEYSTAQLEQNPITIVYIKFKLH